MEALIPQIIAAIPASAIPLVFVIVACWFIYWKINSQRKATKETRDRDTEEMKTEIALLKNEVEQIKALDLASKLAQILTDLQWLKEKLK